MRYRIPGKLESVARVRHHPAHDCTRDVPAAKRVLAHGATGKIFGLCGSLVVWVLQFFTWAAPECSPAIEGPAVRLLYRSLIASSETSSAKRSDSPRRLNSAKISSSGFAP